MPSNRRCLHSPVDITKALQLRIYLHDFDLKKKSWLHMNCNIIA